MLKWHKKLTHSHLQMLLMSKNGFQAKHLGKRFVPQKSRSWFKICVSKMYEILQVKFSQSEAFVSALLDAHSQTLHTLPHGHIDSFWASLAANNHGKLLMQLCNEKFGQSSSSSQVGGSNVGGNIAYTVKTSSNIRFSTAELINLLHNLDKSKVCYEQPIKPKGGEVYVLDWQENECQIKDYVADHYIWVADTTQRYTLKAFPGVQLV